jgi:hypothetical protein
MVESENTAEKSRTMAKVIMSLPIDQRRTVQIALLKGASFEEAIKLVEKT